MGIRSGPRSLHYPLVCWAIVNWPDWNINWDILTQATGAWAAVVVCILIAALLLILGIAQWWVFVLVGFVFGLIAFFHDDLFGEG